MDVAVDVVADTISAAVDFGVEAAADTAFTVALELIMGLIALAVETISTELARAITSDTGATSIDLESALFSTGPAAQLSAICGLIGGALLISFHLLAIARAVIAGDAAGIVRTSLVEVPKAILKAAVVVVIAQLAIEVVDSTSKVLIGSDGAALTAFSALLSDVDALSEVGLLGVLFGVLFIFGAILVWFQLVARAALVYLVLALSPIAFAVGITESGRAMEQKVVRVGLALIVSKLAQVAALSLGAAFVNGAAEGESVAAMMIGSALMFMAAFTPWLIYSVLPGAEAASAASSAGALAAGTAVAAGAGVVAMSARTAISATSSGYNAATSPASAPTAAPAPAPAPSGSR